MKKGKVMWIEGLTHQQNKSRAVCVCALAGFAVCDICLHKQFISERVIFCSIVCDDIRML